MQPVLILGAGINGAALARELAINGLPVCIVDRGDIASGATAYSSRLIHGGLRYLEHGEFDLVRESLAERTRLLRLAPQFVRPLELFIPISDRTSGFWKAARRALRWSGRAGHSGSEGIEHRGLWLVRVGLALYDLYARDPVLPKHRTFRVSDRRVPPVDRGQYRWQCSYYDAAILYPERFVIAMLADAKREAARQGIEFRVLNYHETRLNGSRVEVIPVGQVGNLSGRLAGGSTFEPAAIVNATGAWVDATLQTLHVPSRRLMGGTKGSHFITSHAGLREALANRGIYAEAADGRPVFLLPLGESSLVGTTDIPFEGDPGDAVASDEELDYLVGAVNRVFPQLHFNRRDIDWHYSGVRPLPYCDATTPAAITRRHWLEENKACKAPLYSVIGGKLTTCRSLAEETADVILKRLGRGRSLSTRDRVIPGGESYPRSEEELRSEQSVLARDFSISEETIQAIWRLYGTGSAALLRECGDLTAMLEGTCLPLNLARWVIENEWCHSLDDLICRRLMLLYQPRLARATLRELGELLVDAGRLPATSAGDAIEAAEELLGARYGKRLC
jgi:glycerol-3-phosphate dehydrogenase